MTSERRPLFARGSHYVLGNFLGMLAGVATLAIYARLLSVEQYGIYALVAVTTGIVQTLSMAGVPQAVVRFYWKYAGKTENYVGSVFRKGILLSIGITAAVSLAFTGFGAARGFGVVGLLLLSCAAIPFGAVTELVLAFHRAKSATLIYNGISVARVFLSLAFSVLFLFLVERSLVLLFAGRVVGEAITAFVALITLARREKLTRTGDLPGAFQEALRFSLPLMVSFAGSTLLASGDRYLIEAFLGHAAVGIYSLGYSVAERVMNLALVPTYLVAFPIYTERWEKEGADSVRRFLETAIRLYAGLVLPLAVGVVGESRELIVLFATEKFVGVLPIFPYVAFSVFLYGLTYLSAAGLYIAQRTGEIARLMIAAALANLVANLILLPRLGILGAALATFLGYALYAVLTWIRARKYLRISYPLASFAKAGFAAGLLWLYLRMIQIGPTLASLAVKVAGGVILYLAVLAALDRDFRRIFLEFLGTLFAEKRRGPGTEERLPT